jgi:prepilin-type N-terminal cleavage/methylation domain-containing protein
VRKFRNFHAVEKSFHAVEKIATVFHGVEVPEKRELLMILLFENKAARRGFTLVEILAVLLLLGVLGAVVARRYLDVTGVAREKAVAEVAVVASLGASRADVANPDGGYGVFFDAVLNDAGEIQSGYVLQFDRGYGSGEIIIRRWENGREVSTPVLRINDRSIIPRDVDDPDWWTQQHALSLRVTEVDGAPDQRQVSVVLDGAVLDSSFAFSPVGGDTYTGLRSWERYETPSQFQSMEIR